MMDLTKAFFLGMLQGLAEFLPVSSSGHLATAGMFFQLDEIFLFSVSVHFGTLCSLLFFYRQRCLELVQNILSSPKENVFLKLLIASLPVMFVGFFFYSFIKDMFYNMYFISFNFIFTGLFLLGTYFFKKDSIQNSSNALDTSFVCISYSKALLIGVLQVLALAPGVSRAGITTGTGLYLKIPPQLALDFSFLLGIFSLFSACALEFVSASSFLFSWPFLVGFLSAFSFGCLALYGMKSWVFSFYKFGFYLLPLGLLLFLYLYLK